jgi:hypothetical protein
MRSPCHVALAGIFFRLGEKNIEYRTRNVEYRSEGRKEEEEEAKRKEKNAGENPYN